MIAGLAAPAAGGFTVRDLGVVGTLPAAGPIGTVSVSSGASGINASGATAGVERDGPSTQYAVSSANGGQFHSIGMPTVAATSSASAINNGGNIAGSFFDTADHEMHVFANVNGKTADLGTLAPGREAYGNGINSSNQIVGSGTLQSFANRAFRLDASSGTFTTINPLAGGMSNYGSGINDAGWVVGTSQVGSGYVHAFAFNGTTSIDLSAGMNGSAFGANSQGVAINDKNYVAGFADVGTNEHAFIGAAGGPLVDIGVSGAYTSSYAYGLNNLQQVVGEMDQGGASQAAFVYSMNGKVRGPIDLNSLLDPADRGAWHLVTATGINDSDQICGEGLLDGVMHGFVLTPDSITTALLPFDSNSVPAPPALVLSAIGLGLSAACYRLRRGRTAALAGA